MPQLPEQIRHFLETPYPLTQAQIEQALMNNNAQIDRAKKYEYLKSMKKDTANVENVGKKDSL